MKILFIVNFIIALIYLLYNVIYKKRQNKSYIVGFIVMILCPLMGVMFYLLAYIIKKVFFYKPVDLHDVVFSKEKSRVILGAMEEQERNMVSLEEAIEITNKKDLRLLMMNIVRGDIQQFLHSISLALDSEDTETAHYAAAMLQEALNNFRIFVEKNRMLVKKHDENSMIYAESLMDYMNHVLKQRVFTDMEQIKYVSIFDEIGEEIFSISPKSMTSEWFEALSIRTLEVKEYEKTKKWCDRASEYYPNSLETYTSKIKLYFTCRDKENFFRVLNELRNSDIVVDNETLELLRVFKESVD